LELSCVEHCRALVIDRALHRHVRHDALASQAIGCSPFEYLPSATTCSDPDGPTPPPGLRAMGIRDRSPAVSVDFVPTISAFSHPPRLPFSRAMSAHKRTAVSDHFSASPAPLALPLRVEPLSSFSSAVSSCSSSLHRLAFAQRFALLTPGTWTIYRHRSPRHTTEVRTVTNSAPASVTDVLWHPTELAIDLCPAANRLAATSLHVSLALRPPVSATTAPAAIAVQI